MSGYVGATHASIAKNAKFSFSSVLYPNTWPVGKYGVNLYTICVLHYDGVVQKPRDHLFQKSRLLDETLASIVYKIQKTQNSVFFLQWCAKILHQLGNMGQFVQNMCTSLWWCHTEASWPFILIVKKRQIRIFLQYKYLTSWVIGVNLFIICALQYNGVTQSPHDHLFQ